MATSPAALTADPAAPTFEVEAPNAGTPAAQFEVEKPTTYAPGRAFGLDVARGMGLDADKIKAAEDSGGHDAALKELGSQVLGGLAGFAGNVLKDPAHIADPLNATASALTDALGLPDKGSVFDSANYHRPSPGKLLGALSTIFGGAEAVEKAPGVISKVTPSAESVGRTLRDESGKLKPSVKTAAALTGAGVGHTLGIPGAGELGGLYLGPKIADALIPGREATVAKAVPLSQGPTYPALQAARRAAMKAAQDNAKAELLSSEPATPKISTPTASQAATEVSEGRPATWTNEKVRELAAWGDADAVAQAKARGFGKIPVHFSTAEVTPRSVTRFDAAGNVIEEAGKTAAESGMDAANAPRPTSGKLITTPEEAGQPRYIYRVRDVGESGIPADVKSHAHATESLAEAESYLKSRELVQGKPQEIVKLDVSKLKPSEFDELTGPEGANWFKFKRPFPERVVRKVSE